jgi:basic membrane protein A
MFDIAFDDAGPQNNADFDEFQNQFARSEDPEYDLIICLGFEHVAPLEENTEAYSDQNWALLDAVLDKPNVESWVYAANEGAYIAGETAATLSSREFSAGGGETDPSETTLGFVGGVEVPAVQEFEAGFEAGMKSVNDDFELLTSYVGGFDNPGDVEEATRSMIDNGADVLLHGAGAGGSGLFQACQDRGCFAFGADSRQSETASEFADVILGFYHLFAVIGTDDRFETESVDGAWRYDETFSSWIVEQVIRHHEAYYDTEFERVEATPEEFAERHGLTDDE